jgi:uncharacterized protein YndB with AHSA1/START domain
MLTYSLSIQSTPHNIWAFLTDPEQMKQWMGEPEMKLEVTTDWAVGKPITISGFHPFRFQNTGTVLAFEPPVFLSYSHLSSLSHLPDTTNNYSVISFTLTPTAETTELLFTADNFPTPVIFKHLEFYWRTALRALKQYSEQP